MISPHFVCLSMIVSGRYIADRSTFAAVDGLAWAIEAENDAPAQLPPLVAASLSIFERAKAARHGEPSR